MHIKRILIAVFVILLIFAGCHPRKKTGTMGEVRAASVSYTHLDVYKRQHLDYADELTLIKAFEGRKSLK